MTGHASPGPGPGPGLPETGRPARSSTAVRVAVLCTVVTLAAAWGARSWEWSLVDDPDYKLSLIAAQDSSGWFGGILDRIHAAYDYDRAGGQFRPFLWFYSAVFYLVGPGLAHVLRLAMFLFAIGGVVFAARTRLGARTSRAGFWLTSVWAAAAVLSIRGVFDGLSFLSIMELPTIVFATAGVVDRNAARRVLWLTLAALCKSPAVGGVFALSLVLYRRGQRGLAAVAAVAAVTIVLGAREFAGDGSYTADYTLSVHHAIDTVLGLGRQLALPCLVLLSALAWTRTWRLRGDADSFVLAAAGGGYVVLLLPWGSSSGYNLAAPAFLLVAAAVLVVVRSIDSTTFEPASAGPEPSPSRRLALAALPVAVALGAGGYVSTVGIKATLDRNDTIRGVADWAEKLQPQDVVATNGIESADRYRQILALRGPDAPTRQLLYAAPDQPVPCTVRWLVAMDDQGQPAADERLSVVRSFPVGTVYRVADSGGAC